MRGVGGVGVGIQLNSEASDKEKHNLYKQHFPRVHSLYTVEAFNKDTFGTSRFVLCREVVLFQRCFSIERVYSAGSLLGGCPLLECPLSVVSLHYV